MKSHGHLDILSSEHCTCCLLVLHARPVDHYIATTHLQSNKPIASPSCKEQPSQKVQLPLFLLDERILLATLLALGCDPFRVYPTLRLACTHRSRKSHSPVSCKTTQCCLNNDFLEKHMNKLNKHSKHTKKNKLLPTRSS